MTRSASSARALLGALLAGLLCAALCAPARGADAFGEHYRRAEQLYDEGRYAESIAELRVAFDIKPLPRLLLNIGQLHLKLRQPDAALAAYEAFRRLAPSPPPDVEATLQAGVAQAEQMRAAPVPPPAPPAPLALPAPRRPPPAPPVYQRWWFWTGLGVVAAGLTAGVAVGASRAGATPLPDDIEILDVSFRGAALRPAPALGVAW